MDERWRLLLLWKTLDRRRRAEIRRYAWHGRQASDPETAWFVKVLAGALSTGGRGAVFAVGQSGLDSPGGRDDRPDPKQRRRPAVRLRSRDPADRRGSPRDSPFRDVSAHVASERTDRRPARRRSPLGLTPQLAGFAAHGQSLSGRRSPIVDPPRCRRRGSSALSLGRPALSRTRSVEPSDSNAIQAEISTITPPIGSISRRWEALRACAGTGTRTPVRREPSWPWRSCARAGCRPFRRTFRR
jgi:hypothetical protein